MKTTLLTLLILAQPIAVSSVRADQQITYKNELILEMFSRPNPTGRLTEMTRDHNMPYDLDDGDFLMASGHKDNGGDGFLGRDGGITLRDFIIDSNIDELDRTDLLRQHPKFGQLIKTIANQSSLAASHIWYSMGRLSFYFTDSKLPLLPKEQTGFGVAVADTQIAIKRGRYVLISRPAFERTKDREYLLLHEVLHEAIHIDDWSPLKHEKVRHLTAYIKNNIQKLDEKSLLKKMGQPLEDWPFMADRDKQDNVLKTLLNPRFKLANRCSILDLVRDHRDYILKKEFFTDLDPQLHSCQRGVIQGLAKKYALIHRKARRGYESSIPSFFIYELKLPARRNVFSSNERRRRRSSCQNHAGQKIGREITKEIHKHNAIQKQKRQLESATSTIERAYRDIVVLSLLESTFNQLLGTRRKMNIEEKLAIYHRNVKDCRRHFPNETF